MAAGRMTPGSPFRIDGPTQDGHVARGRVQVLRSDVGRQHQGQDGRDEGRQVRRGLRRAEVPGGRLPRLPRAARRDVRVRAVRHRARQGHRLRRGLEPARRSPPTGRPARRSPSSPSRAWWTRSPRSSRSIRWSCACRTRRGKAPRPPMARSSAPSASSTPSMPSRRPITTPRRSTSGRAGVSPRASGSISAARRAPPSRSTRTAPCP